MKTSDIIIILDRAHSANVKGKCSPEPDPYNPYYFKEWEWSSEFLKLLSRKLLQYGFNVEYTVNPDDDTEPGLSNRANTANKIQSANPDSRCILISCHVNAAASDGQWHNATGYSVYTTKAENNSDRLADCIINAAESLLPDYNQKVRKYINAPLKKDFEENFTLLYKANMPCCLVEHMFMDNRRDVEFLKSDTGKDVLSDIIVNGILNFFAL